MLTKGMSLGPYEVLAPLGAGGMGEVYRARDTRLNREVAIKVLPDSVSADHERLSRFEREARVLASLNHPNIAAIYGVEDSTPAKALVLELVEGPTLKDRIDTGSIAVEEALPVARQIAEALEVAHEKGIIHRDLKPANIKLDSDGKVKVLDFGLAKALDPATSSSPDISHSPTISLGTQVGAILGTAAYMSPEQARGKSVDRRADIWAFGVVFWEMLTGKRLFAGETVSDTLAAVIKSEPDWSQLPPNTPPALRDLLRRTLQKDPRQRLRDIGDARIAIEENLSGTGARELSTPGAIGVSQISAPAWRRLLPWGVAAALALTLVAVEVIEKFASPVQLTPIELSLNIPSNQRIFRGAGPAFVLSPDGSRIAYVMGASSSGVGQIYLRRLDESEARPLEGAQGASPFFSPDGQWIGFYGNSGKLEKVSVFGGAPVALPVGGNARGGSWGKDGTIIYTPSYTSGLYRVSADGGAPQPVTHLDKSRREVTHRWPQILPGGREVLFTASADNNDFQHADVEVASLATGQAKVLVENAYFGRYLSSGYLAYVSGGTLFAVPFDRKNLKLTATAMPVLSDLQSDLTNGSAQISFSRTGTAAYLTGVTAGTEMTVGLFDRHGVATPLVEQPGNYFAPRFSPDGKRLALQVGTGEISVYDIARGTMTPVTFAPAGCVLPVWRPDGEMIACNRTGSGLGISWLPSNGMGSLEPLTPGTGVFQITSSWSPDGKTLAFYQFSAKLGSCCEIMTLPVSEKGASGEPKPYFPQGTHNGDSFPEISPDGRWLAYASAESGTAQIYVVPFPDPVGKWQVSIAGGFFPRWSRVGHELFFVGSVGESSSVYVVPYSVEGNAFQPEKPQLLFQGGFGRRDPYPPYDVSPDGKHFAMLENVKNETVARVPPTVVVNWFARVARLARAGQR